MAFVTERQYLFSERCQALFELKDRGLIWRRVLRDNQSRGLAQPQPGVIERRAQGRERFLMTKRPPETTLRQSPRSQGPRSQKTTDLRQEAQNFLHDCDRSARYHTHRRTFFDWCHRWMMVAVLVSGSSAVAVLSGAFGSEVSSGVVSIVIMLIPTTVGAVSVVWNLTDRARDHELLARRFYQIAKTINVEEADPGQVNKWRMEILGASQEEPAVFYALHAECYNAATRSLGYGEDKLRQISRWRYHLRNWVPFSAGDFPPMRSEKSS